MLDAKKLRRDVLTMSYNGNSVHIGCAFSLIEVFAVLYRDFYKIDDLENFILLSKGHGVMTQYAALAELGMISPEVISTYFKNGSPLLGLAEAITPHIHLSSGSLGHGLPVATGMAFASKLSVCISTSRSSV